MEWHGTARQGLSRWPNKCSVDQLVMDPGRSSEPHSRRPTPSSTKHFIYKHALVNEVSFEQRMTASAWAHVHTVAGVSVSANALRVLKPRYACCNVVVMKNATITRMVRGTKP